MKRRTELDLCRICAAVMVIVIHAGAEIYNYCPIYSSSFEQLNFISTMVRGAVPVFFMLSGTLMLGREKLELRGFLKNHVLRLTLLFFLWSALYAVGGRVMAGGLTLDYDFFLSVMRGHYHMWFLPAMVVCCLALPVVHAAIHGEALDGRYLLFLFFLFGLLWRNFNLTPNPTYILHQLTVSFSLDWLLYLGYMIWGWWLGTKTMPRKALWLAPLIFVLCTVLASMGNLWYSRLKDTADGWLFHYFSLPSFVQATSIFCFFSALKGHEFKHPAFIRALSDCTLGVYLLHPLMMNVFSLAGIGVTADNPALSVTAYTLLLALACFALTYVLRRIPIIRNFI